MATIQIKRVYESAASSDGFRILVDRLWPRGVKKEDAHLDLWMKEIAPSTELRKWFNHDVEKWDSFAEKYKTEIKKNDALDELKEEIKKHKKITLLFGAHDEEHNQAVVLKDYLKKK